ncbi:CDP-glycerol glycerophosphotransferase family protein [Erysipelothrix rhusiopathiae]|nr:CDP-glycerol glycerophosphotransferase family protein [Erysipelothrix rhusiopathiae]MCG4457418.1 CDP-glycerol glycerophosphotransferase family protein [Erysipelothrix rhusiopathiae]MDE8053233.1 CDP-glycerol glycerophosphotransferase family protein [Erysipelothrix rhusiopathiae]MDE8064648.1 CDP-glycerol glycerophosphotransferase family protein [Erysipelothrix rhusiopathiae]MDE8071934.1 CDP-glycerol glycerophosphotransferase family protein [Erysipelothrix rhusiopathiae]MDE8079461.1 CDP-glycer
MSKLKTAIKNSTFLFKLYNLVGNTFIKINGIFFRNRKKQVLFLSFGGKGLSDSPFAIFKLMLEDPDFEDHKFIWAVDKSVDTSVFDYPRTKYISTDKPSYFKYLFQSEIWITNTTVSRGLKIKKPSNVVYINTWHGTPFKKIGNDVDGTGVFSGKSKSIALLNDPCYLVQSNYEKQIFINAFGTLEESIYLTGLPRNDELKNIDQNQVVLIKEALNINTEKKVILFAPTFKEYKTYDYFEEKKAMIDKLSDKYYILYRGHHAASDSRKYDNIDNPNFLNVSTYPNLNDLFKVSDIVITDYSSLCVDFAILDRPIYFVTPDFEEYQDKRGLYINYDELFNVGNFTSFDHLTNYLNETSDHQYGYMNTSVIHEIFIDECGCATHKAIELIKTLMRG